MPANPVIGLVIPIGLNPNLQYFSEALESVARQTFPPEQILVFCVYKRIPGAGLSTLNHTGLKVKRIFFDVPDDGKVTTLEQVRLGFEQAQLASLEYVSVMSSNDHLHPEKIATDIKALQEHSGCRVVYPRTIYCNDQMIPDRYPNPYPLVNFDSLIKGNFICDCSTVTMDTLGRIPFDSSRSRASFWIWWFKIWEMFGSSAFCYSADSVYLWRDHVGQLSSRKDWIEEGRIHINNWLMEFAERNKGRDISKLGAPVIMGEEELHGGFNHDIYWEMRGGDDYATSLKDNHDLILGNERRFFHKLVDDKMPKTLLDFGCGPGSLFDVWHSIPTVHGFDRARSQIETAKKLQYPYALDCGAGTDRVALPYQDGEFDVVAISEVLTHVPPEEIDTVVSELARVCNGTIGIVTSSPFAPNGNSHNFNHDYERLFAGRFKIKSDVCDEYGYRYMMLEKEV